MRRSGAVLSLLLLAVPGSFADESAWHQTVLPHFVVHTPSPRKPQGFDMEVEKMHRRLRFDLSHFSPWLAKEKIQLYLYNDQKSYASGEFQPPPWSNGVAIYSQRVVASYLQETDKKLHQLLAHESTHLLFESYWGEVGREPPAWLNEGLAMLEEVDSLSHPEASDWYRAMVDLPGHEMPFDQFFKLTPTKDLADEKDKDKVGVWYVQAYSVVFYLFRTHNKLQFEEFNAKLRDGMPVAQALMKVYNVPNMAEFKKGWLTWLREPSHRRRISQALQDEARAGLENPSDEHKIRGMSDGFQTKFR